jgi:hypothetical protein
VGVFAFFFSVMNLLEGVGLNEGIDSISTSWLEDRFAIGVRAADGLFARARVASRIQPQRRLVEYGCRFNDIGRSVDHNQPPTSWGGWRSCGSRPAMVGSTGPAQQENRKAFAGSCSSNPELRPSALASNWCRFFFRGIMNKLNNAQL